MTRKLHCLIAVAVVLTGCALGKSGSTTLSLPSSASGPAAPTAAADAAPSSGGTPTLTVPNLIGKTRDEARALIKAAGFASDPESSRPLECEGAPRDAGKINCQDPEAGKVVQRYAMIQINVYEPHHIAGAIVRSQLDALRGMTPDQAKQQLKKLGHDGNVKVDVVTNTGGGHAFLKECGQNKVCYTSDEAGLGLHDDLTLYINPTLTIAPPPP